MNGRTAKAIRKHMYGDYATHPNNRIEEKDGKKYLKVDRMFYLFRTIFRKAKKDYCPKKGSRQWFIRRPGARTEEILAGGKKYGF